MNRIAALDMLRGYALVCIMLDHMPMGVLRNVTLANFTVFDAAELFASSEIARAAFGDEVVDHYVNNARIELKAFDAAVTDWERVRGFERL